MVVYPESRIVNNCHVERTFLVRFTAGPVYIRPRRGTQRRLGPEFQLLTLLYIIFCWEKRYPFLITSIEKWYSFHITCSLELSTPFNCCNSLSLKYTWIDPKTRTFFRLFQPFLSLFATEISDFLTLSYTSSGEIPGYPFTYLKPEKVAHFGRSLPV